MKPGDRVTVPDLPNRRGDMRVEAAYVDSFQIPRAQPLSPLTMHRVRYDDGTMWPWLDAVVAPAE
jgi:hypothetical protein